MARHRLIVAIAFPILLLVGNAYVVRLSYSGQAAEVDTSKLPLSVGQWKGEELEVSPKVLKVLTEDTVVQRRYRSEAGETIITSLVYSDKWESLHPPQNCLKGLGYEIVRETTVDLTYDQPPRQARATVLTGFREPDEWVVELYLFADADSTSATWLQRHSQIMLRYGRAGARACALLLVAQDVKGDRDLAASLNVAKDFAQAFLPYMHESMQGSAALQGE